MKVYAINNNMDNLLLVSGNHVINGGFTVTLHKDGTISPKDGPPGTSEMKGFPVLDVPKDQRVGDYNAILAWAKTQLVKPGG